MEAGWRSERNAGRVLERATQLGDGPGDAAELAPTDAVEDGAQQLVADRVDLIEHAASGLGDADDHDAAVLRHAGPFDEPTLLDPVDRGRSRSTGKRCRTSASRLIGISPLRWSVYRMCSCAMLMPIRSSRSLDAHLIWFIAARKSAMMGPYGSSAGSARRGRRGGPFRISSYHVNNLIGVNHRVNLNRLTSHAGVPDALRPDDRAPAGHELRRPAGGRQAGGGERLRCVLPGRPLRELSRAGRPAHHRRLDRRRRAGPRDPADRARRARLAGDVPPSRASSPRS